MNDQYGQDRFKKFDQHALQVLDLAYKEAEHCNHHYIGTEHLLLGIVHEQDCKGAQILAKLGVSADQASKSVELLLNSHHAQYARSNSMFQWLKRSVRFLRHRRRGWNAVGLTARAKKSLELAVDEARRLHQQQVGTEHMLFGLVSEGKGLAAQVLHSLGVDPQMVHDNIQELA